MSEEHSLPRLPALSTAWDQHPQSSGGQPRKRARHARPGGLHNSSDPAVFSSDDDPGLDNYIEGRKKKRYVGSWFQQQPASSDSTFSDGPAAQTGKQVRKGCRKFVRQFDSGVYLESDGSEDLSSDVLEIPKRSKLTQLSRQATWRPLANAVSEAEVAARQKIQTCLDQGVENIFLWSMGLETLSGDTIRPLSNFACIPVVAKDVAFEQKEPELKLNLSMNRLRLVPGALFELLNLTFLSLRGNKLSELPPAIAKLSNLRQLNVSLNRLGSLPAELLHLFDGSLKEVILHPNPFFQPDASLDSNDVGRSDEILQVESEHLVACSRGRSPLQMRSSVGQVLSAFRFSAYDQSDKLPVLAMDAEEDARYRPSRVASLVEVALQSCYAAAELSELPRYLPASFSHLGQLLERAWQQKEAGGISCTRCGRTLVMPVLEWIEWREISLCEKMKNGQMKARPLSLRDDERVVPFLRRGCSWKCGPVPEKDK